MTMVLISDKTRKFFEGRRGQFRRLEAACRGVDNIVWVHSASYGEFEEVRPVVNEIRRRRPEMKILVTFFSPSGYEYLKDDPVADWVFYLPLDLPGNARRFLDIVRPVKVIVSISDYWLGYLYGLRSRGIDTYLVSARFTGDMFYFKPVGFLYKKAFKTCFTKILLRSDAYVKVLADNGITDNVRVCGDPRMDRVAALASAQWKDGIVERWCAGEKVFVAGSTLPKGDNAMIAELVNAHPFDRFLIVPHEILADDIAVLRSSMNVPSVLYSEMENDAEADALVLIVDKVGMLSKIYRYGFAAYVGGGFDGCPHSVIESAVYGIPVFYGPQLGSNEHCSALLGRGGFSVADYAAMEEEYDRLKADASYLKRMGESARRYCEEKSGAAGKIADEILE